MGLYKVHYINQSLNMRRTWMLSNTRSKKYWCFYELPVMSIVMKCFCTETSWRVSRREGRGRGWAAAVVICGWFGLLGMSGQLQVAGSASSRWQCSGGRTVTLCNVTPCLLPVPCVFFSKYWKGLGISLEKIQGHKLWEKLCKLCLLATYVWEGTWEKI